MSSSKEIKNVEKVCRGIQGAGENGTGSGQTSSVPSQEGTQFQKQISEGLGRGNLRPTGTSHRERQAWEIQGNLILQMHRMMKEFKAEVIQLKRVNDCLASEIAMLRKDVYDAEGLIDD